MHGRSIFYYSQLNVQYLCKHDKMVKVDVDHRKDSLEDVAGMFKLWKPESQLAAFKTLRGGYSGTNYLVETDTGEYFVIKIAHGYSIDEVEEQAKIGEFLKLNNFAGCCYPLEVANIQADHRFVAMIDETEPALLLNYLPGRAADFLIENGKLNHKDALIQIGYNLALMHLLPIDQGSCLRTHHHDGICFLHKHLNGEYYRKFTESDDNFIKNHDFSKFYVDHYDWLIKCFSKCNTFQQSVVHGDPFLDNVVFDEATGKFLGFVDFEDACVGPRILDIACCVVGNCYESNDNGSSIFNDTFLNCLLYGYRSCVLEKDVDQIGRFEEEINCLKDMMKVALLLNASWRFQNFNIAFPEKRQTHGMKYLELQQRIYMIDSIQIESNGPI